MIVRQTALADCYIIEPGVFKDHRGIFFESYHLAELAGKLGRELNFVQDNHSVSGKGVLRGLHFQEEPYAQAKLVRVASGLAQDVVVDIRRESPTFGQHLSIDLSSENNLMLYIPRGMAHGFLSMAENTMFLYKCDRYYRKEAEKGIIYNDPDLNIAWKLPESELILSEKDLKLPQFKSCFP